MLKNLSNYIMHVLITGGSGFIGKELIKELLKKDFQITATVHKTSLANSLQIDDKKNIKFIQCDLSNEIQVKSIFEKNKFDGIFHLAGQTFRKDNPNAQIYFQSNLMTTLNLLEACRNFKVSKFILSSSIATYGLSPGQNTPEYVPVDEKHKNSPYDFYDLSKHFAEKLCSYYSKRFNVNSSVLRYSRVFGPLMGKGLFDIVTKNSLLNKPIQINGDVSTDFVYVDDVVQANILSFEKANGFNIFNVGSGEEITLLEIANEIVKLTNSSSKINFHDQPKSRFSLDISKAKRELGYLPTSVKISLIEVVNHIKDNYHESE